MQILVQYFIFYQLYARSLVRALADLVSVHMQMEVTMH